MKNKFIKFNYSLIDLNRVAYFYVMKNMSKFELRCVLRNPTFSHHLIASYESEKDAQIALETIHEQIKNIEKETT